MADDEISLGGLCDWAAPERAVFDLEERCTFDMVLEVTPTVELDVDPISARDQWELVNRALECVLKFGIRNVPRGLRHAA